MDEFVGADLIGAALRVDMADPKARAGAMIIAELARLIHEFLTG
jgi:hypothetical protein